MTSLPVRTIKKRSNSHFDFYLKGKGTFNPAEATIFVTGSNTWKKFTQWPPRETMDLTLYLRANGEISMHKANAAEKAIQYMSDPAKPVPFQEGIITERTREYMLADQRFVTNRPDVLVFQTAPLEEDMTLTGPVLADLQVAMTGTDADFIVKLIDVYPDTTTAVSPRNDKTVMQGYQMLVRGEVLRGKFRSDFAKPIPLTPNAKTTVNVNLPDIAHTFKKRSSYYDSSSTYLVSVGG